MTKNGVHAIRVLLEAASIEARKQVFLELRQQFPIHDLERKWNVPAEVVLEAIARAPDLTQRGLRGVIAEAYFAQHIIAPLLVSGWKDTTPAGDNPFDFRLLDGHGVLKIQVKNQRKESGEPKLWKGHHGVYVVETQKTRSGKNSDGESTRPYRFGEFDILAVCLHPSTNDWSRFLYTVADWLIPRPTDKSLVAVLQPVDPNAVDDWTSDFETAVTWSRRKKKKTIAVPN